MKEFGDRFSPGLGRATIRYPDLDPGNCKLVGWGAGAQFRRYYPLLGIDLDYTICIFEQNIGNTVCGVPVFAPNRLLQEDPKSTLVVIFSNWWFDVLRQVDALGKYRAIRAFSETNLQDMPGKIFRRRDSGNNSRSSGRKAVGLLVQGPLHPGTSRTILELNRSNLPDLPIVLSTWQGTGSDLIEECEPYVDHVIRSPIPSRPGKWNALLQKASTLAGLEYFRKIGIEYAVKSRTDQALAGTFNLDNVLQILDEQPFGGGSAGVRSRILFDGLTHGSWRFIPFQVTDQLQIGTVPDLIKLWRFEDRIALEEAPTFDISESFVNYALLTVESTILRSFLARIGFAPQLSVASSWEALIRLLGIIPDRELSLLSWKAIALYDVIEKSLIDPGDRDATPLMANADYDWWLDLKARPNDHLEYARRIMERRYSIHDFSSNRRIDVGLNRRFE
ncbi:MAG: hypothetical protein A3H27_18930 [Acidobacteria bacterium RIFCSPLOWO2_02_FULL_59_13]|nr:MAG: hypothetical protein A3H27_18930 [Acidobacteria bacterium RIFCSPLOWO2_02_FULL_59_13]